MKQRKKKNGFFHPKSESDYTVIWKWKVSNRLAGLLGVIAVILSLLFIFATEISYDRHQGKRTFGYDSILLNFVSGNVRIKAEAGYIAYEGNVKNGRVSGMGTLYKRDGSKIYSGEFEDNEYSGNGKLYGDNGIIYEGEFKHNLYQGTGSEYSDWGTIKYQGMFDNGKRNGKGILFDDNSNPVYEGNFYNGAIVYRDFLGKTTKDAAKMYTGNRDIYYDTSHFIVDMKDIGAMYSGSISDTSLDNKMIVNKVFIKSESSIIGGKNTCNIDEVKEIAGAPVYEGNVNISAEEAVALSSLSGLKVNYIFDEAMEITGYDKDKLLYIYSFQLENIQYTFYSETANGKFIMYSIEQLEAEGKGANE